MESRPHGESGGASSDFVGLLVVELWLLKHSQWFCQNVEKCRPVVFSPQLACKWKWTIGLFCKNVQRVRADIR